MPLPWVNWHRLGNELHAQWAARSFDVDAMPDLASALLERAAAPEGFSIDMLVPILARAEPSQQASSDRFSDFGLTLFARAGLVIELLVWLEASTSVHEHDFAGAFQVLVGSSLHTTYRFDREHTISPSLAIGRLGRTGFERLRAGAVRPIAHGAGLIHRLFHLERPSVSLVVRAHPRVAAPQWSYAPPTLAFDPFAIEARSRSDRRLFRTMRRVVREVELDQALASWTEGVDIDRLMGVLLEAYPLGRLNGTMTWVGSVLSARFGAHAATLQAVLDEAVRESQLLALRHRITAAETRLFLALLLNGAGRREILDAFASTGQDPIVGAARQIMVVAREVDGVLPFVPSLEDDGSEDLIASILRAASPTELEALLAEIFDPADLAAAGDQIAAIERAMRQAPLLRSLFRDDEALAR